MVEIASRGGGDQLQGLCCMCACTSSATNRNALKLGLSGGINDKNQSIPGLCEGQTSIYEQSVGHGMYEGQACGECALIKCVNDTDASEQYKCLDKTPFIHQRVDNAFGTSQEVSVKSFCKRWGCTGDVQKNGGGYNKYQYIKNVDCISGKPIQ